MNSTLIVGDALQECRQLPSKSIDLVITSPPYNIHKSYEKNKLSYDDYINYQHELIKEYFRLLKNTGSLFYQVGFTYNKSEQIPLDVAFYPLFIKEGFKFINRGIWIQGMPFGSTRKFSNKHETILWFGKTENHKFNLDEVRIPSKDPNYKYPKNHPKAGQLSCNPLGKNPGDVFFSQDYPVVRNTSKEKVACHPCQFPESLITTLIKASTDPGDVVLDPFNGVGTTGVVCKELNRSYIGIERDPYYVEISKARINNEALPNGEFVNRKSLINWCIKNNKNEKDYKLIK